MEINSVEKRRAAPEGYHWTQVRTPTRRAVVWPGYVCDLRCVFCYNDGMERRWRMFQGPDGLKEELDRCRFEYGNRYIDFMGGEITLHPEVLKIMAYCAEIGLKPTCITHALRLARRPFLDELRSAGVHDFLISTHGIGETAAKIFDVPRPQLFELQQKALDNLAALGIPFRTNTTLIDWNRRELPALAGQAVRHGALVTNWICFNPHFAWSQRTDISFQAPYSDIAPYLREALLVCEEAGVEANVRYFPFCQLKGFEKHIFNCTQLPYDHHEWDYNSWHKDGALQPDRDYYYRAGLRQAELNGSAKTPACTGCRLRLICDGFGGQYVRRYGYAEAGPYPGSEVVESPAAFIEQQWKIEEIEAD